MPPQTPLIEAHAYCPCGSATALNNCCLPFIEGKCHATTAEQLMRSRYTAHTQLAIDYLWSTWSSEHRLRSSKADVRAWAESCEWLSLHIISTQQGGAEDETGTVEFIAVFKRQGQLEQHHEVSQFKRAQGTWLYVDHK